MILSGDETTNVGPDAGTLVSADYRDILVLAGKVNRALVDVGKDDHDRFIRPEERLNLAMARQ